MLSSLVIALLPRSKRLLISWPQSPYAVILEPKKIKSVTVSTVSPSICYEVMGLDAMIFVFIFCFFLINEIIYFTLQLCWFCHTLTWIRYGCTCVPHPEPPSHLPPHTIPLGHPSAPARSTLFRALNLDWRFVSHMIIYMFQCQSPKSSHPRPLPQSPKDCSIYLLLSFKGLFQWIDSLHQVAKVLEL